MQSFWHPVSSVFLPDPVELATPVLLELVLKGQEETEILYAGDRMWPSIRHGDRVQVRVPKEAPGPGDVVLCNLGGVPDLLRVVGLTGGRVRLRGDAACGRPVEIDIDSILAVADRPRRTARAGRRRAARMYLDFREMFRTWDPPPSGRDPAGTIREKYDYQAPFYVGASREELDPAVLDRVRAEVPPGGRILVAGCGVGTECFGLAREGWNVTGIDFSESMIRHAEAQGRENALPVTFEVGDLRSCSRPVCSLDAVLFTYDLYSFLPTWKERKEVLENIARWLKPAGVVFLSARRVRRAGDSFILTVQWLARRGRGRAEWGASHTRWVGGDASLHRSYVRYFSSSRLAYEFTSTGYRMEPWDRGYTVLRRAAAVAPVKFRAQVPAGTLGQEC